MARKRSNGEGSIHKLPSGSWQMQVMDGYKPDGTRKLKTLTAPSLNALKKLKLEYDKKKATGMLSEKDYLFMEWTEIWFEHHKHLITATTQEGYKYTLKTQNAHFGNRRVADIKVHDIEEFMLQQKNAGVSQSKLTKLRGMLSQIFNKAVANDLIMKNPVAHMDKMKKEPQKPRDAFSQDEIKTMMADLPEDKIGWSIRLMLFTGMREGELLGLEPRHIAEDGSWIKIEQAAVKVKGTMEIGPPKTEQSYRTIPVPELVRYCARNLRDTDKTFIWESPKKPGYPCSDSHFRAQYNKAMQQLDGVRILIPYCCRHTCISHLVALGVDPITIISMVGHVDKKMLEKVYGHPLEHARQDAIKRFDDAFSNRQRDTRSRVLQFPKSS